ncbi:hypothetical protein BC332_26377 [Capsicum chinense]|nr:hypothetical protein BC332_26377 [Capsicum chinense]
MVSLVHQIVDPLHHMINLLHRMVNMLHQMGNLSEKIDDFGVGFEAETGLATDGITWCKGRGGGVVIFLVTVANLSAMWFIGIVVLYCDGCRGGSYFSDVLVLNLEAMAWNILVKTRKGPGPRDSHSVVLVGHRMVVFRGAKSGRNTNVKAVHLHSHTATLVGGDKLVIFGGSGKGEANYLNDLHVLDLKTMRWSSPEVRGELNRYQGDIDVLDMDTLMLSKAITIGRDPTPSELHLHVYTHNHDGKFFVVECSRLLHVLKLDPVVHHIGRTFEYVRVDLSYDATDQPSNTPEESSNYNSDATALPYVATD